MIIVETVNDVVALLRPLLEVAPVRLVAGRVKIDLPRTAGTEGLPEPARALITATLAAGGTLRLVPAGDDPPFSLAARARLDP